MIVFIPIWVAVVMVVFRVAVWLTRLVFRAVVFAAWATGILAVGVFRALGSLADRDPRWARRTLRGIRGLPEA